MQQENMRLVKVVAERTPAAEREVLTDLISSNERLIAEKQKASPPLPVHNTSISFKCASPSLHMVGSSVSYDGQVLSMKYV